ncbi:MAG: energy-coupling factor transporter ATPase [Clostridia bacterium]
MEKIIEIKDMSYSYKTYSANGEVSYVLGVSDINVDFYEGEFVAIVGHNGSGKSTLAKILNALLIPKGVVKVFGKDTCVKANRFDIRKDVGMVFQNPDNQTVASIVEEDVAFGPENLGVPQQEIVERVKWALSSVGMLEYAKRSPHKLSGGQKQRIAIAGALALKPKVLVLDESTAMLDPSGRKEVISIAKMLNKELKMTVILITHFMEEVLTADRVIVMNKGGIVAEDTPKQIFTTIDLNKIGLALPRTAELNSLLYKFGLNLPDYCVDANELGDKLCQLL